MTEPHAECRKLTPEDDPSGKLRDDPAARVLMQQAGYDVSRIVTEQPKPQTREVPRATDEAA